MVALGGKKAAELLGEKESQAANTVQEKAELSVLLGEIEQRRDQANLAFQHGNRGYLHKLVLSSADVPALVKFGRMAVQRLEESCSDAPATFAIYKNELTAILTQAKQQEEQSHGE